MKAIFGFTVIPMAMVAGCAMAYVSQRVRDLFFVLLVFLGPLIERLDVNFVSREWYRGTSRGFEVSVLDILALSLLVSAVLRPRPGESRAFWPASMFPMLLFFLYACFNVAISDPRLFGYFELLKMVKGVGLVMAVAFYLRGERELRLFVFSLAALVCYEGLLALKQRYVDGINRVPGTIDDSNSLSVFVCMTAPVLVAGFNSRLPAITRGLCVAGIALGSVAMILTISRAGVIILAVALAGAALATTSFRLTPKKIAISFLVVVAAGGLAAKSWKTLRERFASSTLEEEYGNHHNLGRGYYLRVAQAMLADHWLGVGLNNWSYWASDLYGRKLGYRFVPYKGTDKEPSDVIPSGSNVDEAQAAPAHCLAALTAGELGIPGLIFFVWLWLRWFQMGASFLWERTRDPMRRMGVGILFGFLGIFLQSLTEWVFRQTPIYYVFHVLLGVLAALYYLKKKARREASEQLETAPADWEATEGVPT
ncbi:MAG TPA: O-antigen ligase family protein [Candidatus Baltobacteraceae bacterium]|nr:O-antigen ligase family protein [Candidatus Baltobacteraceae bacterium]